MLMYHHQVMCQVGNYCLAEQLLANQYYSFQSKYNIIDSMYTADNAAHLMQLYSSSELQIQIMLEVLQNYYFGF